MDPLVIVLLVALAEVALNATWTPVYFTRGLPLFQRTLPRPVPMDVVIAHWPKRLPCRRLDADRIAFGDELVASSLFFASPVMHGLVRRDPLTGAVRVIGLANVFPPLLLLALLWCGGRSPMHWAMLAAALVLVAVLYIRQRDQYLALCRRLEAPA